MFAPIVGAIENVVFPVSDEGTVRHVFDVDGEGMCFEVVVEVCVMGAVPVLWVDEGLIVW